MPKWWNESELFTLQNCPGSAWTFVLFESYTSCTLQVLTEAVAEAIAQKARETEEDAAVDSKDPQKCGRMWQTTAGSDSLEIKQSPSPSWCQNLWMRQPEKARMLLFKARLHGVTVSYIKVACHPCSSVFLCVFAEIVGSYRTEAFPFQNGWTKISVVVVSMGVFTDHWPAFHFIHAPT